MATELLAFQKLDIYVAARELAAVVHRARIADAELRDQATRASKSVFLGICEGLPNEQAGMRRRYFTQAHNSLCETVGALDLARAGGSAFGAVPRCARRRRLRVIGRGLRPRSPALAPEPAARAHELALRVKRMLRALMR